MRSILEHHAAAVAEFTHRVHSIQQDQWHNPTPCAEWDVRTLVNHLVGEQLWVVPLMNGSTVADVGTALDGDLLGIDPVSSWDSAATAATQALHAPGAMGRTVHLSFGDFPGSVYTWQLISDLTVHAWDLARGISADASLDPELAAAVMESLAPDLPTYVGFGVFAEPTPVPDNADVVTRLIALTGRRP